MHRTALSHRLALLADIVALSRLMDDAIGELQKPYLTESQIAASRTIMGMDRRLIEDGTYFVIESAGSLVGCGGWSFRQTLYGGDNTPGRSPQPLNPTVDPARVRAMYTHPAYTRMGIATMILGLCEAAAKSNGFHIAELMATLAGEPLYLSQGYRAVERTEVEVGKVTVPLIRMAKFLL